VPSATGPTTLAELLGAQRVLPLVEVDDDARAVQLARVLLDLGWPVMEIALRTPGAMSAIAAVRSTVADAIVGAGTVVSPEQLSEATTAGAAFAVSPGSSVALLSAADRQIPFVPGVATATELMRVAETRFREVKFFPAEAAGGVATVAAMGSVAPSMRFLPTGGIDAASVQAYLALDHVFAVGGSWVCPAGIIREGGWDEIAERVRATSVLTNLGPS
jgi:2-dehydro-3-deoxyphosphogluconate aldolase/(4S)-4-hydroxy-2-oxoglutarate aldolase